MTIVEHEQCDQMARLFNQYLVNYINGNVPKRFKKLPDQAQNFDKYYLNHPKMAKDNYQFSKVAKFRQNWSH